MREIVLDTETTGLDPKSGHRIVEIGCLELINHIPSGPSFHVYLNPDREMPPEAFEEFFGALAEQARRDGGAEVVLRPPTALQLAGMMGTANGALSFLCLSLARYWQSALFYHRQR